MAYADQMPPQVVALPLTLALISVVVGILMTLLFRLASNPFGIRQAKRRVQAQFLAVRLFCGEPALVWRAQGRLLTANLHYIGVMLPPMIAAAVPFLLAFPYLEARYARAPLPVGSETVLTVKLRKPFPVPLPQPHLEMPAGLRAETPGVRVPDAGEISWGVQVTGPVSASINAPGIEWVHLAYGDLRLSAFGLEWPWEAWFIAISAATALLAKNRLGAPPAPGIAPAIRSNRWGNRSQSA